MAVIKKDGMFMGLPMNIARGNPIPLDKSEIWYSYEEMANYAINDPIAYVGQILGLVDEVNGIAKAYIILNAAGDLQEIASSVDIPALKGDDKTVVISDDIVALKNWGEQYYKFIPDQGSKEEGNFVEAHYEPQKVDEDHPWPIGLEPKVTSENGVLVLGWYEPNQSTIEGINSQISTIQTSVNDLNAEVTEMQGILGEPAAEGKEASGIFAELDKKANAADVYDKAAADKKIEEAVAAASHLKRKEVASIEEIDVNAADAEQYVYMIPSGLQDDDNKYYEYMVMDIEHIDPDTQEVFVVRHVEQVGSWEVDLSQYAKKSDILIKGVNSDEFIVNESGNLQVKEISQTKINGLEQTLQNYVVKVDGYGLVQLSEIEKLSTIKEGAEPNFIKSVDLTNFAVDENGKLILNALDMSKVNGLSELSNTVTELVSVVGDETKGLVSELKKQNNLIEGLDNRIDVIEVALNHEETGLIVKVNGIDDAINNAETGLITKVDAIYDSINNSETGLIAKINGIENTVTENQTAIETIDTILNDEENGLISRINNVETAIGGLENHYVTIDTYANQIGDFSKLKHSFENSTLVDEVNELNDRLIWQELTVPNEE